jgi:hypothetical protein
MPLPVRFCSSDVPVAPDRNFALFLAIKQLAQRAHETLWDDIPLHAIRNAHEVRAKELTDADEDGEHTAEIYVAYYKFLQFRNHGVKDDPGPEYVRESSKIFFKLC